MSKTIDTISRMTGQEPSPADAVNDGIALKLRQLYSGLESEGIPDNLLMLLDKLDEAERAQMGALQTGLSNDG